MSTKPRDKVAVVTGSSSGNGRAVALAAEGAAIVCSDIRREAREGGYEADIFTPTDDVIRANGGKPSTSASTASYSAVQNLINAAVSGFGRLDVMVNNAGIFTGLHTTVDETEDDYDRTIR